MSVESNQSVRSSLRVSKGQQETAYSDVDLDRNGEDELRADGEESTSELSFDDRERFVCYFEEIQKSVSFRSP